MRFQKGFKPYMREITDRRIACAERAIKKQQNKIPLFKNQVDWPTPMDRILEFDKDTFDRFMRFRKTACRNWLIGRILLRGLDKPKQDEFLNYWNNSSMPGTSEYFLDALRSFIRNSDCVSNY